MKLRIGRTNKFYSRQYLQKATPLFVHVFMIVSVGLYAVMGAWCMQKIEGGTVEQVKSSNVVRRHATLPESFIDDGNFTRISSSPPDLPSAAPKHRRRRRGEDKVAAWGVPSSSSRHRRAAVELRRSRDCVVDVLKRLTSSESCGSLELDEKTAAMLDACYRISVDKGTHTKDVIFMNSREEVESVGEEDEEVVPWSFVDALLFTFTVITTIGYGNVAPRTFEGRLFVIFYGLVGIPFTLLAIADLGKFLSEIMYTCSRAIRKGKKKLRALLASRSRYFRNSTFSFARISAREKSSDAANGSFMTKPLGVDDIVSIEEGSGSDPPDAPAVVIQGEDHVEEEDFIDDGQALSLFILFVVYIALGALILSQYEPDLDFFKAVYFNFVTLTSIGLGDIVPRRLTMKALVKNLGDQFNLPTTVVKDLNLDTFVENAIKVEAGEMETLRPPPFDPDPEELEVQFVEEDAEPAWIADPTPSPSPEPSPVWVPTPKVPTPVPSPPPPREPTPEPVREPTPKPRTPTPEPTPVPSPEPVREPTPPPPPRTPTPPPPPREPTPELVREPTPPPPPREPTPPPPRESTPEPVVVKEEEPLIPETKPRKLTAKELEEQKRRAYSEEAWRRYQEYQKQWKKFRATQKPGGAATTTGTAGAAGGEAGPSGSASRGSTGTRGSPGAGGREEIKQLKKTVPGWAGVSSRPTSATGGSTPSSSTGTPNRSPSRTPTTSMSREPSRTTMSRPTSSATSRAGSRPPSTAPSRSASNASGRGGRGRSPAPRGHQ
ncbi:egl-23 [Pristionchus pacificus]|nr:egl-23 [Pristionchus pacificus]|eukprot:PDM70343.1 egl-23 [Pristionchus pacificus]